MAEYNQISREEFDVRVSESKSWNVCDCRYIFLYKTPFALDLIHQYADNQSEFVKRSNFELMCSFAVHDKKKPDEFFFPFFELIEREAWNNRIPVKKTVNRALRQIDKRNENLRVKANEVAERILEQNTTSAKWISRDALKVLNDKIKKRTALRLH